MTDDTKDTKEMTQHEASSMPNYFETYGQTAAPANIKGQLLKFNKGDYLVGSENDEVPPGTKLVAHMDELLIGWMKWIDNKPAEQIMGKVVEGYKPARRKDLGDLDESAWDVDNKGIARDPWQFSNNLVMRKIEVVGEIENEDYYTFTTSSRGGIGAIGELCKVYGKEMRKRPDEYPVITLEFGVYTHPDKEIGRVKFPIFEVVGWEPKIPLAAPARIEPPKAEVAAAPKSGKKPKAA